MIKFPKHKGGLFFCHNPHVNEYMAIEEYLRDYEPEFETEESLARSVETNELWTMDVYRHTPIGHYSLAAPTFEELIAYAQRADIEADKHEEEHNRRAAELQAKAKAEDEAFKAVYGYSFDEALRKHAFRAVACEPTDATNRVLFNTGLDAK